MVLAGLAWKLLMDAFERAGAAVPPDQWTDVRFEDVLLAPRPRFDDLLKFAGLDWTARFEAGFAHHRFQSDRSQAFRDDLSPANLVRLDRVLAGHLRAWGYAVDDRPPTVLEDGWRCAPP